MHDQIETRRYNPSTLSNNCCAKFSRDPGKYIQLFILSDVTLNEVIQLHFTDRKQAEIFWSRRVLIEICLRDSVDWNDLYEINKCQGSEKLVKIFKLKFISKIFGRNLAVTCVTFFRATFNIE